MSGALPFRPERSSGRVAHSLAGSPRQVPKLSQYLPFALFYILVCSVGITSLAEISLSVALFPLVIYGYASGAYGTALRMLPGARRLMLAILAIVLTMCAWDFVTAFGADSFVRVFRPLYGHATGLAIVLSVLALSRTEAASRRTRAMCLVILALSLATTYFVGPRGYSDRFPGLFKHPNQLGLISAMAALIFFNMAITSPFRKGLLYGAGLLASGWALLLSGSKTSLVVFAGLSLLSVPLLAFLHSDKRKAGLELYRNMGFALAALVAGAAILPFVSERAYTVLDSFVTGNQDVENYRTVTARSLLWEESWKMAETYPLTGVGAGQLMSDGTEHSHNVFMDAMRTTGFPGLGLTILFFIAVVFYIFSAYRAGQVLNSDPSSQLSDPTVRGVFVGSLVAMLSYLLSNQMSDSFGPSTIPFFYTALAFSLALFVRKADPLTPSPRR